MVDDVAIHWLPHHGDQRNYAARLVCETGRRTAEGFQEMTRALDDLKSGAAELALGPGRWADLQNALLAPYGLPARLDPRSL